MSPIVGVVAVVSADGEHELMMSRRHADGRRLGLAPAAGTFGFRYETRATVGSRRRRAPGSRERRRALIYRTTICFACSASLRHRSAAMVRGRDRRRVAGVARCDGRCRRRQRRGRRAVSPRAALDAAPIGPNRWSSAAEFLVLGAERAWPSSSSVACSAGPATWNFWSTTSTSPAPRPVCVALRSLVPMSLLAISAGGAAGPEAPLVTTCGTLAGMARASAQVLRSRTHDA